MPLPTVIYEGPLTLSDEEIKEYREKYKEKHKIADAIKRPFPGKRITNLINSLTNSIKSDLTDGQGRKECILENVRIIQNKILLYADADEFYRHMRKIYKHDLIGFENDKIKIMEYITAKVKRSDPDNVKNIENEINFLKQEISKI